MSNTRYTGLGSRKPHQKSRFGCVNCKRRRIKCDEEKPACRNCAKHSVQCDFTATSSPSLASEPRQRSSNQIHTLTPDPRPEIRSPMEETLWDSTALELLHNWSTSTCYTVAETSVKQDFMRIIVPQIGFSFDFILHGILAISALHMAHFKPNKEIFYLAQADRHHNIALRKATSSMAEINGENCHALYIFAILCSSYTLASGPKPGDFLLFSEQGLPEWLVFFRGLKTLTGTHGEMLKSSILAPLFETGIRVASQQATQPVDAEHLAELQGLIADSAADTATLETLTTALNELSVCFSFRYNADGYKQQPSLDSLGVWLYRVSEDFVVLLQHRQPAALVILAYFCVLLNDLGAKWQLKNWVNHLLTGIYECLDGSNRLWMRWSIEEIGWIPQ